MVFGIAQMPSILNSLAGRGDLRTTQGFLRSIKDRHYQEIIATDPGVGAPNRPQFPGFFSGFRFSSRQVAQSILSGSAVGVRAQARFIIDDLTKYTEASIKLSVLETIEILVVTTPIDTSWAAHSWFPALTSAPQDNGGYLIEPGDEESGTAVNFDDISGASTYGGLGVGSSGGYAQVLAYSDYDDIESENDPAAAFLRENDPDFGGESGEIIDIEADFKLQERRTDQKTAIERFSRGRIFVNQNAIRNPTISNNVPYIAELNEGKSKQTPRNFVGRAIIAGLARLELRAAAFGTTSRVGGRRPRILA